jgi:hypothetical protein
MSLPTNLKALDLSLLDSLTQASLGQPSEYLTSLFVDRLTEWQTMSTQQRSSGSFSNYTVEYAPNEYRTLAEMEYHRRMDYERLRMLQQVYEPGPAVMFQLDSALLKKVTDIMENAETSALSGASTAPAPSRSSTGPSSLSGASLTTSFLSRKSASNSKSSPGTSKSGLPKLLSSVSKAIATKSSSRS